MSDPTLPAVSEAMREAVARETRWPILKAMAANYHDGHRWDHLDADACAKGADEIRGLRAEIARLTGERERWEACALACELRLAAAEAETARLRAALGKLKVERKLCDKRIRAQRAVLRAAWPADALNTITAHRVRVYVVARERLQTIRELRAALAEAEARGRRQERYDLLLFLAEGADRGAPFHAAVSAIAALSTAPAETQKPETGESA